MSSFFLPGSSLRTERQAVFSFYRLISYHWTRVQNAYLQLRRKYAFQDIDAPLLRTLYVFNEELVPTWPFQPLFQPCGTPRLTSISWFGHLHWGLLRPLLNSQLKVLRVHNTREPNHISADMWIDVLQNMQSLSHLELHGPAGRLTPTHGRPRISLPHLERLSMSSAICRTSPVDTGTAGDVHIFTTLNLPPDVDFEYIIRPYSTNTDVRAIYTTLDNHAMNRPYRYLEIFCETRDMVLQTRRSQAASDSSPVDGSMGRIRTVARDDAVRLLVSPVHLKEITDIHINFDGFQIRVERDNNMCKSMLKYVFRAAPLLSTLTVSGQRAAMALQASKQANLPPALQVLIIDNVLWESIPSAIGPGIPDELTNSRAFIVEKLADALVLRRARGHRLKTLEIRRGAGFSSQYIEYIRRSGCVDSVEWDGIEGLSADPPNNS